MEVFTLEVFAWIPQAEVPNPISLLPGGVGRWGPGACGPCFGGDDFTVPPASPAGWAGRTFRARQSFAFRVPRFGDPPLVGASSGVVAGTTTVLTARRSAGGRVCHALTALVRKSAASVAWKPSDGWYEARLQGAAEDPVPVAVGARTLGAVGAGVAGALTPQLEWDLVLRFQRGSALPLMTRARYGASRLLSLDIAAAVFPAPIGLGGTAGLVHGLITVRRFPSYVVYVTVDHGSGAAATVPIYFADASHRALGEIVVGQTDVLRMLRW